MNDLSEIVRQACESISAGSLDVAAEVIRNGYPFRPLVRSKRSYSPYEMTKVFVRDGFVDRYKGTRLIFPPTLRVISTYLPSGFPFHKNGKMSEGHLAYWELFPSIDHVNPVAREGNDSEDNWVCCSMLTNSIKSNWTLEQLGWTLLPPGRFDAWDGLTKWFIERIDQDPTLLGNPYLRTWYRAAERVMSECRRHSH